MTVPVLQNVLVLSAGRKMIGAISKINVQSVQKDDIDSDKLVMQQDAVVSATEINVITLSLDPAESALITFLKQKTQLAFALRPANDETVYDIPRTGIETLTQNHVPKQSVVTGILSNIEKYNRALPKKN
jgi:hypothetical protein